jgi:hypothetical protein
VDGDAAENAIMRLAAGCDPGRSISPEDAARALAADAAADWHAWLAPVRQAAVRLARAGRIDILRKGKPVAPDEVRGVIRLRLRGAAPSTAAFPGRDL